MDGSSRGTARVVEYLGSDPLRFGRDTDSRAIRISPYHDACCPRPVTAQVCWRGGMLTVRVEPTIGAATPAGRKIGVRDVNTGIHACNDNTLPIISLTPKVRRIDQ